MIRTVVLHYHLFKNAGTSLDQMLRAHLGDAWITEEFSMAGDNNTAQVADWIADNPEALAFSSHTMVGPLPEVDGVEIIPVILLRNPLARIASAYRFERKQEADTWGAELAKEHDLEGYVRARLARPNDRQCRNFQVARLATLRPGPGRELFRANAGLNMLQGHGVVGRVEHFDAFRSALLTRLAPAFPDFDPPAARANTTRADSQQISLDLAALLTEHNTDDIALLAQVNALLGLSAHLD
ncbi:MAG: hypothetical protein AAFY74_18575 [Pseudomonadota bacterium]|mgnify:CR=1 FL=1